MEAEIFVVFDLDGTLADVTHRRHLLEQGDHKAFYAACVDDKPIENVIEILLALRESGDRIEIWTGRSDAVKLETLEWLSKCGVPPSILVRMRPAGERIDDFKLKRRWLRDLAPDDRPMVVFEDRKRCVEMYRGEGITCFQVAPDWDEAVEASQKAAAA